MDQKPATLQLIPKPGPSPQSYTGQALAACAKIEDDILSAAATVLSDSMMFMDVEPGQTEADRVPNDFLKRFDGDFKRAQQAWRIACYSLRPKKDAPVGLLMAAQVAIGIMDAKAKQNRNVHVLNVTRIVNMEAPREFHGLEQFDEIVVEGESDGKR